MKNKIKLIEAMHSIAIIAIAAIIGFSFTACDEKTNENETTAATASFAGTWNASTGRSIVFTGNTFNYKVNNVTQYSGTFSASGTTITFNESILGTASGNFALTATTLTLSNHTWDNSVNGTYTKEGGSGNPPVFTLNNISTAQQTEGSSFFVFGLFPTGTTKANVETDANLARTQSAYPAYVIAYAGGTSGSLPFQGLGTNNASISSTLTTSTGTTWNSTGTYDGWVCLYNGTAWTSYKSNSAITVSGNVTKNAQTDFTKQDGSGHSHSYNDTWSKDATQHWKECSCGDKTQVANHTGNLCGVCGYNSNTPVTYTVTVVNGIGSGNFAAGATVAIIANEAPTGQIFKNWTSTSTGVIFANANNTSTSFTMPANPVTVTADYENVVSLDPSHFYGNWTSKDGTGTTVRWTFSSSTATFNVSGYSATYSIKEWQPVSSTGNDSAAYPSGFKIVVTQTGGSITISTRYFFASASSNNHMAASDLDVLYGNGVPSGSYLIYQRQ